MAITGFGGTLSGATSGSISGIQQADFGELSTTDGNWSEFGDTNRVSNHIPCAVTEGPAQFTVTYNKTVYDTIRDAQLAQTTEAWTYTDSEASTHVATGYISSTGGRQQNTDGPDTFTFGIQPSTCFTHTPSA